MKLVDKMKDEELGVTLLYNFTKGVQKPVEMDLYNVVLPLLYHDEMRKSILKYNSFEECVIALTNDNPNFTKEIIELIEEYKTMTERALGIAMLQHDLEFKIVDQELCGILLESKILDLNEAIVLGHFLKDYNYASVINVLKGEFKNIVILQSESVGKDVDLSCFEKLGKVTCYPLVKQENVHELIKDAHIVITNKNILSKKELEGLENIELICLFATGTNNIDLEYCNDHNIAVANVKGYSTHTVAQHTFSLLLPLIENNAVYDEYVKTQNYTSCESFSYFDHVFHDLSSMTWGIVGLGEIGRKVAHIATAFGADVQYYSTSGRNSTSDYQQVDFDTLLKTSDIISIHAPLNEKTTYLFDEVALSKMKRDSYLINVGRGKIIDENALVKLLNEGHFAGVGLDVFEHEPLRKEDALYKIKDMRKVILTPHVAWGSIEARSRLIEEVYKNIDAFLQGERRNIVTK